MKLKGYIIIFVTLFMVCSCEKEEYLPYEPDPINNEQPDLVEYVDGGTIPVVVGTGDNDLVGTTWVLIKLVSAFATEYPNDTLNFVTNTNYTVNSGAVRNYQLSMIPSSTNKELSLYYFFPFGGSHYSAQVGLYFVEDGEINNVEFQDIQNSSKIIRAWFIKI